MAATKIPVAQSIGQRYGRLVVQSILRHNHRHEAIVSCVCDCGAEIERNLSLLRSGNTSSCGCLHREIATAIILVSGRVKHGEARGYQCSPEYVAWLTMRRRCCDTRGKHYRHYGGRGIAVCERWIEDFPTFLTDMGRRPTPQHSLDRIDNDGNYEPGNCRWATQQEQCNNTRHNRLLALNGRSQTLAQWTAELGVDRGLIQARLRLGWSIEDALTKPPDARYRRYRKT